MADEKRFSLQSIAIFATPAVVAAVVFVFGRWFSGNTVTWWGAAGLVWIAGQLISLQIQRALDMTALNQQRIDDASGLNERLGPALSGIYAQLDEYKLVLERLKELSARFVSDNAPYIRFAHINEETESVFAIRYTKIYEIYNATWNIEMYDNSALGKHLYSEHKKRLQTADEINYYVLYEDPYYADAGDARAGQQLYISIRDMERFLTEFIGKIKDTEKKRAAEEALKEKWRVTLLPPNTKLDKNVSFILARNKEKKTLAVRLFVNSPIFMDERNAHKAVFVELNEDRFGSYDAYLSKRNQTCGEKRKVGRVHIDNGMATIIFAESSERQLPPAAQPALPAASSGHSPSAGAVAGGGQSAESAEKAPI